MVAHRERRFAPLVFHYSRRLTRTNIMSDLLFPEGFEMSVIPHHPAELGRWLRKNKVNEDIIQIICCDNQISGAIFQTLTDKDVLELIPQFLLRKQLRDWIASVMAGKIILKSLEQEVASVDDRESLEDNAVGDSEGSSEVVPASIVSDFSSVSRTIARARKRSPTPLQLPERVHDLDSSTTPCSTSHAAKRQRLATTVAMQKNEPQGTTIGSSVRSIPPTGEEGNDSLESLSKRLNLVVPSSVKESRKKGDASLPKKAENDVIKNSLIILQSTVGRERPTDSEFELCAQKVIKLIPEMKDPLPPMNKAAFKQWNTVKVKLRKAYYNRKPVEKPRKQKTADKETESTQEGHDAQLKTEMKAKKPDIKKISSLLPLSLARRRKWIEGLSGKGSVKAILDEYPGFKDYDQVMIEVSLVTKRDDYAKAWGELLPKLWDFTVQNNKSDLEAQGLEEEDLASMEDDEKTYLVLSCLPSAWGIKEPFLKSVEAKKNFDSQVQSLSAGDVHLLSADTDGDIPQLFVIIDKEVVVETDSFTKGLFAFFGVHFLFNLEYPKKLKYVFQFLEEYLFGIQQKKRTAEYRKGVHKLLA